MTYMPQDRPNRERARAPRRQRPSKPDSRQSTGGFRLIAVQSISCVVVLLVVLAMRLVGGNAFEQLRDSFNESIMSNSILSTFAALFEQKGTPSSDPSAPSSNPSSDSPSSEAGDTESTGETTGSDTAGSSSSEPSSAPAVGGEDIKVNAKKVLYAPAGATFAKVSINRAAKPPLEKGTITSYFGYREDPIDGGDSFHKGLDIGAEGGAPIATMFDGRVIAVGSSSSYGNYVKIDHGGSLVVMYAHCAEILVKEGAVLRAGESVAKVGSTGNSTGNHLHVEALVDNVAYDPLYIVPDLY